ncbi:hypothetical protein CK222_30220 [Mesorhizobium sp. WSM3866]|nr:hypothetical protein CK221_27770 [Mesorhizobium sp. WSM3868]PBB40037.1 hypothetical protein CK222_30220 [Mesorhizobium sp. WSM3866]PBB58196.1 hypothetical protein CK217_31150 [Mesorhizobium loti]PBB83402.1 hypothetical protein CK216_29020 [Mesorhizobium sp. WSM3876]
MHKKRGLAQSYHKGADTAAEMCNLVKKLAQRSRARRTRGDEDESAQILKETARVEKTRVWLRSGQG